MVCLTVLNRSVLPFCWNFRGRTFECPFVGGSENPSPTHMTFSPKASPVWASVSPLSHPPKSHARFSFGVKLNLTIFLLESEIQSPLHFWFRVKPTVEFCSPKKYGQNLGFLTTSSYVERILSWRENIFVPARNATD